MGNINFNLRPSREDKLSRDEKYYSIVDSSKNNTNYDFNYISSANYEIREQGEKWFNSGKRLEDASDELRNNNLFVIGYNHAKRLAMIMEIDKNRGREFYSNGGIIELLSEEKRSNLSEYFILGYEEAKLRAESASDIKSKEK